jgi:hypothetical protein
MLSSRSLVQVARNNAKSATDELEYRLVQLKEERTSMNAELQLVRDSLAELQSQCQRHLEDKREMKAVLSELQRREREAQGRQCEVECALAEERKLRQEEAAEWQQFQTDLLMTVRVANDFKTEAQSELERVVMENKAQRDKLRALEAQLDKLNNTSESSFAPPYYRWPVAVPAPRPISPGDYFMRESTRGARTRELLHFTRQCPRQGRPRRPRRRVFSNGGTSVGGIRDRRSIH